MNISAYYLSMIAYICGNLPVSRIFRGGVDRFPETAAAAKATAKSAARFAQLSKRLDARWMAIGSDKSRWRIMMDYYKRADLLRLARAKIRRRYCCCDYIARRFDPAGASDVFE